MTILSDPTETIANGEATARPSVLVNGTPLPPQIEARLLRVVVDNDLHLPGMFELTFLDLDGATLPTARLSIGSTVTVSGAGSAGQPLPLIVGEVTGIEGLLQGVTARTVVRGYTGAHRLQRARRSRSFVNVTDAGSGAAAYDFRRTLGARPGVARTGRAPHQRFSSLVDQVEWPSREIAWHTVRRLPPPLPSSPSA